MKRDESLAADILEPHLSPYLLLLRLVSCQIKMLGGILEALCLGLATLSCVTALPRDVGSDLVHLQRRKDWLSPEYKWLFQNPLPIPPVKQPLL